MNRSQRVVGTGFGLLLALSLAACSSGGGRVTAKAEGSAQVSSTSQFGSIPAALAYIGINVDGPIVFPTELPAGIRMNDHPVYVAHSSDGTVEATLDLRFGRNGRLEIVYGAPSLTGCDDPAHGAREVRVGRYPALLVRSRGESVVLWPATPKRLQGRYELRGTFTAPELLRMARSMRPVRGLRAVVPSLGC